MINVKNLRIGNVVKRVVMLPIDNSLYLPCDIVMLRDCAHYGDRWAFEGVPIDETILTSLGFTVALDSTEFLNALVMDRIIAPGHKVVMMRMQPDKPFRFCEIHRLSNDGNWSIDIDVPHTPKYVHELQNLVWAWTGEELMNKE